MTDSARKGNWLNEDKSSAGEVESIGGEEKSASLPQDKPPSHNTWPRSRFVASATLPLSLSLSGELW